MVLHMSTCLILQLRELPESSCGFTLCLFCFLSRRSFPCTIFCMNSPTPQLFKKNIAGAATIFEFSKTLSGLFTRGSVTCDLTGGPSSLFVLEKKKESLIAG